MWWDWLLRIVVPVLGASVAGFAAYGVAQKRSAVALAKHATEILTDYRTTLLGEKLVAYRELGERLAQVAESQAKLDQTAGKTTNLDEFVNSIRLFGRCFIKWQHVVSPQGIEVVQNLPSLVELKTTLDKSGNLPKGLVEATYEFVQAFAKAMRHDTGAGVLDRLDLSAFLADVLGRMYHSR